MSFLSQMLGIEELNAKIERLEERVKALEEGSQSTINRDKARILDILEKKPLNTVEVAQKLRRHRSWTYLLLNQLEREGKVKEDGKREGETVYAMSV